MHSCPQRSAPSPQRLKLDPLMLHVPTLHHRRKSPQRLLLPLPTSLRGTPTLSTFSRLTSARQIAHGSAHFDPASSGVLRGRRFFLPVASLEDFLEFRRSLGIAHNFLFSPAPPFTPLSTAAFSDLLRWAFQRAGIVAPPGSTRHVSFSDAFARGAGVSDCLAAGDWIGFRTFFRHYHRPCDK